MGLSGSETLAINHLTNLQHNRLVVLTDFSMTSAHSHPRLLCNVGSCCPIQLFTFGSVSETPPWQHLAQLSMWFPNLHQVQGFCCSSEKKQSDSTAQRTGDTSWPCCHQAAESSRTLKSEVRYTCLAPPVWPCFCDLLSLGLRVAHLKSGGTPI